MFLIETVRYQDLIIRVYGDVFVGDFPNDQEAGVKKIILAMNVFVKNCVSQIVTVMDESVNLKNVNFNFRPMDETIYCSHGTTDKECVEFFVTFVLSKV